MIPLTVVTATIPERADMLHQLGQCIARQAVRPFEWIVKTDWDKEGPAATLNSIVADVETPWVFRCDDDDLFDTDHFQVLSEYLTDEWDVVYTWPRVDPPGWIGEDGLQVIFPMDRIHDINWIASAAAIKTELWDHLGGYRDVHNEDHDLWQRAVTAGAKFLCIPRVTWTYRLGDWPHLSQPEAEQ